jgi:allophanate hydrolase subunit 1
VKPFDPARAEPFLLKAGDAVRFYPDASPGERRVATA